MKARTIISGVAFSFLILSCANEQKQQPAIIGGADSITQIVIAEESGNQDKDTVIYKLPECSLWYTKELPEDYKDKKVRIWTEREIYWENVQAINVFVANPTDAWWLSGRGWHLDVWNGKEWESPKAKKDLNWFDDGFAIQKAPLLYCFRFPIGEYFHLSKGKYRINKGFSMNNGKDRYTYLSAEFEIK